MFCCHGNRTDDVVNSRLTHEVGETEPSHSGSGVCVYGGMGNGGMGEPGNGGRVLLPEHLPLRVLVIASQVSPVQPAVLHHLNLVPLCQIFTDAQQTLPGRGTCTCSRCSLTTPTGHAPHLAVGSGAGASSPGLDAKHVVQQSTHKVVVEVPPLPMPYQE